MSNNTKNYDEQGGARKVIGGELRILTGAKITPATGTQATHLTALKVNYTTGDLDAEAEVIAAVNATNTRINAIVTALEGVGIYAAS